MVGLLTIELAIFDARTLKEKRKVMQGFKQRLRNEFNVSVEELAHGDSPKCCTLGVAMIGRQTAALHSQFDKIVDVVRRTAGLTLLEYERDIF